jgi:ankyrin repeat protein
MTSRMDEKNGVPENVFKAYSSDLTPTNENIKLFAACESGWVSLVNQWLGKGGSPDYFHRPEDQKNSLHVAAENGHTDVVVALLEHGVQVDSIAITTKSTALIFASQNEEPMVTKLLLQAGAKVDAANGYGNTALHAAASLSHNEVGEELIKAGADVRQVNNKGSSPLHLLCYNSTKSLESEHLCKLLLKSGADHGGRDHLGTTPLLVCCTSGRDDLIKILLSSGASLRDKDDSGKDALAIAKFYMHSHITDLVKSRTEEGKQ